MRIVIICLGWRSCLALCRFRSCDTCKLLLRWSEPLLIIKIAKNYKVLLANRSTGVIVRRGHVSQLKVYNKWLFILSCICMLILCFVCILSPPSTHLDTLSSPRDADVNRRKPLLHFQSCFTSLLAKGTMLWTGNLSSAVDGAS